MQAPSARRRLVVRLRPAASGRCPPATLPGVTKVIADKELELVTDNGPAWIGAPSVWDGSPGVAGTKGEGIVAGIIDTGINHDHPSFADVGGDGYDHTTRRAGSSACAPWRPSCARACRPYRAKTKGKVERVLREVKEDFLAWLTGQVFPEHPSLAWYDAMARRWTTEVVATRRHRTTGRIVGEAWAAERPLLTPVSRRLLAKVDGHDTLVPVPEPVAGRVVRADETVELRPLTVYAELVR